MERVALNIQERGKKGKGGARSLRRDGFIPAVLYRAGESMPIQLVAKELSQFISRTAGEQVIVNLKLADEIKQAIVKDYQVDPIIGNLLHVDFQEILATEETRVMVHVVASGEPIGVKRDKGVLQYGIRDIEIECLPDKIPGHIEVDVSHLGLNQSIHVNDLRLGEGIRILTDSDELLATVTAIKEEVVAAPEVVAETVEPEIIKKGKKTTEEES
ncbi:MAG: 50S ribosomal protein L25 [Dissulfurispiraceae bacterium]